MALSCSPAPVPVIMPAPVVVPRPRQSSGTRGDMHQRLRLRTHSTFAHFTPDELETGFRRLEQAIAADPGAPAPADPATLLTLERR